MLLEPVIATGIRFAALFRLELRRHSRFPLRLSRRKSLLRILGLELSRQFSAGIFILCEDFRYSHIIRERPGIVDHIGLEPMAFRL